MKRFTLAALAALAVAALLGPGRASAQFPYQQPQDANPYKRPAFSPYLNMARGGNPAVNYYGLVRPQMATSQALQTLAVGQQIQQFGQSAPGGAFQSNQGQDLGLGGMPVTGHAATFFNYSTYFPQGTAGGQGGRAVGSIGQAQRRSR